MGFTQKQSTAIFRHRLGLTPSNAPKMGPTEVIHRQEVHRGEETLTLLLLTEPGKERMQMVDIEACRMHAAIECRVAQVSFFKNLETERYIISIHDRELSCAMWSMEEFGLVGDICGREEGSNVIGTDPR